MSIKKLNQALAVEKTVKSKREDEFTSLYRDLQNRELVTGFTRAYQPKNDDGERFPTETKRVQLRADEALKRTKDLLREIFNVTALKDWTNCVAKGDVEVDGVVLAQDVPATYLLFLEKKLATIADFVRHLPVLSQDTAWTKDDAQGLYRSEPTQTTKTKKVEDFKVIVQATKEHPAQVAKVVEDVTIGTWTTTHFSGALPGDAVKSLLERVEKLQTAVKTAREEANQAEIVRVTPGQALLDYLFAP